MTVTDVATPASGYAFLGPASDGRSQAGPLIVDPAGQPVWFEPIPAGQLAANVRVQEYRGEPVLTWWQGKVLPTGYGQGEGIILDSSYRVLARVRAAGGRSADLHEFLITPQGTALITCYPETVPADLTPLGGPRQGHVYGSIIQEIDISSGRLLLEWRGLQHVALSESHASPWDGFDYLHANSIDVTPDGNLLVSARHTWALYKLHRRTGRVMWQLGGKRSNFAMGGAARFSWQHDARQPAAGVITLFDDGEGLVETEKQSRGIVLTVDSAHRTVHLSQAYRHPKPLLASAMGSAQMLPDGHMVIGWGTMPWVSEFTSDGALLADLSLPAPCTSYRGLRFAWVGTPTSAPALVSAGNPAENGVSLYASWNGATEVTNWLVLTGASAGALAPFAVAPRSGFETEIPVAPAPGYAAVIALDGFNHPLGTSRPIRL